MLHHITLLWSPAAVNADSSPLRVWRFFSVCFLTHHHEMLYKSWWCEQCKCVTISVIHLLLTADFSVITLQRWQLGFFFVTVDMLKLWLCVSDFTVWSCHVCSLQSSWSGVSLNGLGHQWLSILWHKEPTSCCTCYARGVMFLSPWFTERSVYWRRFKIHYSLVLPRKIVEQSIAKAEVRTGSLQEKDKHWFFIDNFACICVILLNCIDI